MARKNRMQREWDERAATDARNSILAGSSNVGFWRSGEEIVDALVVEFGITQDTVVLDVGCGIGRVAWPLSPRCKSVIGYDVSSEMLGLARAAGKEHYEGVKSPRFVAGNGEAIRVKNKSVDLAYEFLVFQHVPTPSLRNLIKAVGVKVKKGGKLVFRVNLTEDEDIRNACGNYAFYTRVADDNTWTSRYYDAATVNEMLNTAGFDVDLSETVNLAGRTAFVATKV